jgi:hypothetical protein
LFLKTKGRLRLSCFPGKESLELKKKPSVSSENELYYKRKAIGQVAAALRGSLNANALGTVTLVPVPGSKAIGHPDYDARMEQICRLIRLGLDIRNLLVQSESTEAAHEAVDGDRIAVEDLLAFYSIDEALAAPPPTALWIMDDVLTAVTHFRITQIVLSARFPGTPIFGIFVASRVFPVAG